MRPMISSADPPEAAPAGAALQLEGVNYNFKSHQVLNSIRLEVRPGEIYGFLGLNGAGKTTAIRLILGLLRLPAENGGSIRIFGRLIGGHPIEVYRQIGFLMETFAPFPYLSAAEHFFLQGRVLGLPRETVRRRAERLLQRVHLSDAAHKKTRKFSMGMRRRLGIAMALLGSPRLLILDEPANGLDPQGIADLRELMQELQREEGVAVFFSSHLLGEVEQLCQRIGIIHEGRMLCEGEVARLVRPEPFGVRLRARPIDKARQALAGAAWVKGIQEAGRGDGTSLLLDLEKADVPRLAPYLVAQGVEIHEIRREEMTLEAFFKLKIQQAGGEATAERLSEERTQPPRRQERQEEERGR
ncbi:MAG: ABC transporter ATP-binding protein [Planctomycetes bacterium]|nr:ABC transporter ATP-binding protein [Planctomycetota bacterium]